MLQSHCFNKLFLFILMIHLGFFGGFLGAPPFAFGTTNGQQAQSVQVPENSATALKNYFLETRYTTSADKRRVVRSKSTDLYGASLFLKEGELVRVKASEDQILRREQNERLNQTSWLAIEGHAENSAVELFLKEDWKAFLFLEGEDLPIFLQLKTDDSKPGITLLSEPTEEARRACQLNPNNCAGWVGPDMSLILTDTRFSGRFVRQPAQESQPEAQPEQWELFYQVHYARKNTQGQIESGTGWSPSRHFERKLMKRSELSFVDRVNAESLGLVSVSENQVVAKKVEAQTLVQEVKAQVLDQMFPDVPENVKAIKYSRWVKEETKDGPSNLDFRIDFEWRFDFNQLKLKKTGNGEAELNQNGLLFGFGGIAPVLLNFEVGGSLSYLHPASKAEASGPKVPLIRFEQFIVRLSPLLADYGSFKWGAGWHLISQQQKIYGFSSIIGVDLVGIFENRRSVAYGRLGPIGNSEGFSLSNFEVTLGYGLRLNPSIGYRSLNLVFELSSFNFKSKSGEDQSSYQSLSLGLRRAF